MMRVVFILMLLASGVVAFAPTRQSHVRTLSSAVSAIDPKREIGVLPPIGYFECVQL